MPSAKDGLVVIGAGLPRTGTASLSEALGVLYGSPCYHMRTVFKDWSGNEGAFWARAVQRKLTPEVQTHKHTILFVLFDFFVVLNIRFFYAYVLEHSQVTGTLAYLMIVIFIGL